MGILDIGKKKEIKKLSEEIITIMDSLMTELDTSNGVVTPFSEQLLLSLGNKIQKTTIMANDLGNATTSSIMINMNGRETPFPFFWMSLQGMLSDLEKYFGGIR